MGPDPDPLSDAISVSCSHALVIPYFVHIFSRHFHGKFPLQYHTWLLDRNDDLVFRNPVMRIMGCKPNFVAGELQKREFIVEVCDVTILVGITVHTAPFADPFIGYGFSLLEFYGFLVTFGDTEEVFVDRIMGYESSNICECACIDAGFLVQFPFAQQ